MKIKLFLMSVLMLVSASSFAQFTQGNGKLSRNSENGWKSFYVQYNSIGTSYSFSDDEGMEDWKDSGLKNKLTGIAVGYNNASSLSQTIPLFLEYGGGIQYSWYYSSGEYYDCRDISVKISLLSIKAPISFIYRVDIPNSDLHIEPNVGFDFRVNIYGDLKYDYTLFGKHAKGSMNILDKDDCNKSPVSIFQVGWHIGLNLPFNRYYIGLAYSKDISKIYKNGTNIKKIYSGFEKIKLSSISITAGIRF